MAKQQIIFPYVNGRQIFTMPYGYDSKVTYHVWGGGGGAGGDSNDQLGGNGSAGSYTTGEFIANPDDEIEVIVGQGGQEGSSLEASKKIYSITIPGTSASGVGPTATYGFVNDPTAAIYPQYNNPLRSRTFSSWTAFMNAWAVSDLPNNTPGTEEVTNNIYFPESGNYTVQIAGDNSISVWFRDQSIATNISNFKTDPVSKTISVPNAGVYQLRYVLTNNPGSSGNPAGAAIVVTRSAASFMGSGAVQTYPGNVSTKNIIWSTRYGRDVDVTSRVPVAYAPVVSFYEPQSGYGWGGFPDNRSMAFINAASTWTADELARLNLSFDTVVSIGYPVTITGTGNIDQVCATGYYTFARGQTWQLAQYNWLGNPGANTNLYNRGTGTPSNWTERQWYNDNKSGRSSNVTFASWELPVPPADKIFIVGYGDGVIYNAPSQRGSNNVSFTVNSTQGQRWAGGQGGASVKNVGNKKYNYYGGWGGQIGSNQTSGGGGGGGGASLILLRSPGATSITGITIAGGGGGGGGAGFKNYGSDASSDYEASASYPNSVGAGSYGSSAYNSGGGGGGGGGGCDGGRSGTAATQGGGVGSGGEGAWSGGSQAVVTDMAFPTADFVMIGRGGDGGSSGGGGGAGDLLTGKCKLLKAQFIQVGGAGDERLEGSASAIWYSDTDYIVAGSGGRGGALGASWARNGNGQSGGCISGDTGTATWGGSGGGAGTTPGKTTASGGPNKSWSKKPSNVTSYTASGGGTAGSPSFSSGGGGGAGGGGKGGIAGDGAPAQNGRGGNGGPPRTVSLGSSGKSYTLGGGGGGSAGAGRPSPVNVGLGGGAGAGDGASGAGNELEFTQPGSYSFFVPRNVTTIYIQGVGAGGGGGNATRGGGGGGSGGYLPRSAYPVAFGQEITVRPGGGGGGDGQATVITLKAFDNIPETVITLNGGRQGQGGSAQVPLGGAGGTPGGNTGNNGGNPNGNYWISGSGAGSPYGEGGNDHNSEDRNSKPGNGGTGAGGGGGVGRSGGIGGNGFVRLDWSGQGSQDAQPNTGSGGGGGYDGGGGNGGSGFVAIAYPGKPLFNYSGRSTVIQQNGYTIHEFYTSGNLIYRTDLPAGKIYRGNGIYPQGSNITGFVPGTAAGGVGNSGTDVYPVRASAYNEFLNNHGVWNLDPNSKTFARTYFVQFAQTGRYNIRVYADNGATVSIDDGVVVDQDPTRDNGTYWYRNGSTVEKRINSGLHKISITATNLSNVGAFGMTITPVGQDNNYVFNSRTPPVNSGSGTGGNGLVILEFDGVEGTSKIKVDNDWKKIVGDYVKVSGAWKNIQQAWVKVNGSWRALFGGPGVSVTVDTNNFGPGPTPATPTSQSTVTSSGGGGGGCCVVATALTGMGIWQEQQKNDLISWCERWLHDNALGECFRRGYQVLGSASVLMMRQPNWFGRAWTCYASWAFDNGTNMVRGKSFSLISVPNSIVWILAFMLVGTVVTKSYAKRCWKRLY